MASVDVYRRLQQSLDRMPVGFPATESGVELRILERLFAREEAEIAIELSALPEPLDVIHRRLRSRLTRAELEAALERMAAQGLIEKHGRKRPRYGKSILAVGIYERQLTRLTAELERDVRSYFDEAFGKAFHSGRTPQLRTVPINVTLRPERHVASYDDIRGFVRGSAGPFAAMACICRRGKDLLGESCRVTRQRENCLTIGKGAEAMVKSGAARHIARDEMLRLLDEADAEGLVLQPQNTKDPLFVCCCCGCCCGVLTSAKRLENAADYVSSNYYAEVDRDACQECGTCETRCQMDAVSSHDGVAVVTRSRCIGCGLCVSTCPSGAMRLERKAEPSVPPRDTPALYARLFRERYGSWGMAKAAGRHLLGLKV